ncbi:MAG: DUF6089 family protein [Saprospiraceae bacterium]
MKIIFFLFLIPFSLSAQHLEGGIFLGSSTYYGDLDPGDLHLDGTHFGYGLMLKYNVNDYVSIRGSVLRGQFSGDDARNSDESIQQRNLSFRSSVTEFSVIPEFNILGFNPYDRIFSPYVFGGIAVFRFNPEADLDGQTYKLQPYTTEGQGLPGRPTRYDLTEFAVPFGAGIKLSFTEYWNISFEIGYRVTFTDYIDDVSTTYVDRDELIAWNSEISADLANKTSELTPNSDPVNIPGAPRGNPNKNDRYVFTGVSITYNFLDGFGSKRYGCPTNF